MSKLTLFTFLVAFLITGCAGYDNSNFDQAEGVIEAPVAPAPYATTYSSGTSGG